MKLLVERLRSGIYTYGVPVFQRLISLQAKRFNRCVAGLKAARTHCTQEHSVKLRAPLEGSK
jgi:hypothetical protein